MSKHNYQDSNAKEGEGTRPVVRSLGEAEEWQQEGWEGSVVARPNFSSPKLFGAKITRASTTLFGRPCGWNQMSGTRSDPFEGLA